MFHITHHSEDLLIIDNKGFFEHSITTFRFNENRTNGTLTIERRYLFSSKEEEEVINYSLSDIKDVIVEGKEDRTGLRGKSHVGRLYTIAIVLNSDEYLLLEYNYAELGVNGVSLRKAHLEEIVTCIKGFLKI